MSGSELSTYNAQQIDLLQFSGFTAIPVLEVVADYFPDAKIRLLLASDDIAALYGWNKNKDFHLRRIDSTVDHCSLLMHDVVQKKKDARFTIEIWRYTVTPSIAGIIVDDWLVSIGWYSIYPSDESPTGFAILGHNLPVVTVVGEKARSFLKIVRDQFAVLISNRDPDISLRIDPDVSIKVWE